MPQPLDLTNFKLPAGSSPAATSSALPPLNLSQFKLGYSMTEQKPENLPAPDPVGDIISKANSFSPSGNVPGLSNVETGAVKQLAKLPWEVADLGASIGNSLSKIPGLSWLKTTAPTAPEALQSKGAGQEVGNAAAQVGEFFLPGEAEAKATEELGKVIDAAKFTEKFGPEAGKALTNIMKGVSKMLVGATSAGAVTAAQTGSPEAGAGGAALGAVAAPIGKLVESTGEGIAKMFIPKSDEEAGMLQAYKAATPFVDRVKQILGVSEKTNAPTTAASTAFEQGLMGTESMMGVQAKRAQTTLWKNLVQPALDQSEAKIDIPTFLKEAEEKLTQQTEDPTRLNVLKNALDSIKEDFSNFGQVPLSQLQKFKEGWAKFVPERAYKGQPISGALNDVRNTLAGMAREKIYSTLGDNVKQAYLDYGNLHGITALGRKAMTGAIKGGTGTTLKNLLEMATVPIGTVGGQTIYKVGQGIEIFGRAGATVLKDALGIGQDQSPSVSESSQ